MGTLGNVDPNTGQYSHGLERAWSGFSGKYPPTDPRLPQGFGWLGPYSKNLANGAGDALSYDPAKAAGQAGVIGSGAAGATAAGTLPGTLGAFGAGLGGLGEGMNTGFLPDLAQIDAVLRPGLDRSFERGAAAIREQSALTGNLSSSGATQQISDYRGGLENALNQNVANIYGGALPAGMNIQSELTRQALGLPAQNAAAIYNPTAGQGIQGMEGILQAIQTAMSAVSGAPFYAKQGSSGNGALGAALGGMFSGKGTGA